MLARETSGGTVAWYLADRLGTVRDLVDNSGSVIDHVDYGVFGNVTNESSPSNGDRFKYAKLESDAATGHNFALHRVEDSATGRWLSQDPISFSGRDTNLYCYVKNDTVAYTDSNGTEGPPGAGPNWGPSMSDWFKGKAPLPKDITVDQLEWYARRAQNIIDRYLSDIANSLDPKLIAARTASIAGQARRLAMIAAEIASRTCSSIWIVVSPHLMWHNDQGPT